MKNHLFFIAYCLMFFRISAQDTDHSFELVLNSISDQIAKSIELDDGSILVNNWSFSGTSSSILMLLNPDGIEIRDKAFNFFIVDIIEISNDSLLILGRKNTDTINSFLLSIVLNKDFDILQYDSLKIIRNHLTLGGFLPVNNSLYFNAFFRHNDDFSKFTFVSCKLNTDFSIPSEFKSHELSIRPYDYKYINNKIYVFSMYGIIDYFNLDLNYLGRTYLDGLQIFANNYVLRKDTNSFIIGGTTIKLANDGSRESRICAVEIDTNLFVHKDIVIESEYTDNQAGVYSSIALTKDAFYLMGTKNLTYNMHDTSFISVSKINYNFEIEWEIEIKKPEKTFSLSIVPTKKNGCIITSVQFPNNLGNSKVLIIKIDSIGNYSSIELPQNNTKNFTVYPNPGSNYLKIKIRNENRNYKFKLFNIYGEIIKNESITTHNKEICTSKLNSGIYLWQIIEQTKVIYQGKWIKK